MCNFIKKKEMPNKTIMRLNFKPVRVSSFCFVLFCFVFLMKLRSGADVENPLLSFVAHNSVT